MRQLLLTLLIITLPTGVKSEECVILLHGLARDSDSMNKMENALLREEYKVVNHDYPSTREDIPTLAGSAVPGAIEECGEVNGIHFVTHSMGGILVRYYLKENAIENLGRVVMLGPPNHGSEIVDKLGNLPGFKFINGEAGEQLGTSTNSVPNRLGPVNFDLGIIAGTTSFNPIYSAMIPGDDDGKVSAESTRISGMSDHILMPVSHTFMMRNRQVIGQTLFYLKNGYFKQPIDTTR